MKLFIKTPLNKCLVCFKTISNYSIRNIFEGKIVVCNECLNEMNPKIIKLELEETKGYALYPYNSKLQAMIYQYKGCYDIALADIFLNHYSLFLKVLFNNYIFVPVPSFQDDDIKRGFNHIEEILKKLNVEYVKCLEKTKDVKQASNDANKRKQIKKYLILNEKSSLLKNKKVVVFDDVLTTGSTMKACINLLKTCKLKKLKFLVISYTSRDLSNFDVR